MELTELNQLLLIEPEEKRKSYTNHSYDCSFPKEKELKKNDGKPYNRPCFIRIEDGEISLRVYQKILCSIDKKTRDAIVYGVDHSQIAEQQINHFLNEQKPKSIRRVNHTRVVRN